MSIFKHAGDIDIFFLSISFETLNIFDNSLALRCAVCVNEPVHSQTTTQVIYVCLSEHPLCIVFFFSLGRGASSALFQSKQI